MAENVLDTQSKRGCDKLIRTVMLSTAKVNIKENNGTGLKVRALLNSGFRARCASGNGNNFFYAEVSKKKSVFVTFLDISSTRKLLGLH